MFAFEATFYDGATSEPRAVQVQLTSEGSVLLMGEGVALRLGRGELRIAPRLGDTPRSIFLPDGQKIETSDNDAVDALARIGGGGLGAAAWVERMEGSWPLVLSSLAAVILVVWAGVVWGIPLGALHAAKLIPADLAHQVGRDSLVVLDRTLFSRSKAEELDRIRAETVFADLAALHPELPLRLELRRLGSPNAFALPDGSVVLSDELLTVAEHADELAAVIAHEIGHVYHRHGLRMALESSSVAILIGVYLGDASQISTVLAALPALFSRAGYSRAHEAEADEFALELMERAGVEPQHFANILRRLGDSEGSEAAGALQYLSSHPSTAGRITSVEGRSAGSPSLVPEE